MRVTIHDRIGSIAADAWNAVAGDEYPFLRHEFLDAAESTGCVADDAGWLPCHLTIDNEDGSLRAAIPLYEKHHSWGEFVFDWAWANAYERAGFRYYPKLVSAAPSTPATSRRLLLADPADHEAANALIRASIALADERACSSVHVLFPADEELGALEDAGLKLRKDCQFHWRNRDYADFDAFLATFSSAKRKKARRDRRHVAEAGIAFRRLTGHELTPEVLERVYEFVGLTFARRGSMPYYNLEFFSEIAKRMPDELLVILAEKDGEAVAAAVFFVGRDVLYGRYWGGVPDYNALHFETCYYQGIEYCIEHGLKLFEPGTQGEHKVSRGFTPSVTHSAHWLAHPEFLSAIGQYVEEEARHVERYMDAVDSHSPYRRGS